MAKQPAAPNSSPLRPRTVRISDRDWEKIVAIADGCLKDPGELLRLLATPSPPPDSEGNHEPYVLSLMHPEHPSGLRLRSYVCQRQKPMLDIGEKACPFCAIRAIADQSRCNLALGIGDLSDFMDSLKTPAQRKSAIWFTTDVVLFVRKPTTRLPSAGR